MHMRKIAVAFVGAALAVTMTGCVKNDNSAARDGAAGTAKPIEVKIADDKCELSTNTAPSGTIKFSLSNEGPARNEFEVLAKDKLQIMGEMENLAAGDKRDFTVQLEEGTYYTACKKNMVGALVGLKEFKVTKGEGIKVSADDKKLHEEAVTKYTAYVKDQAGQLVDATQKFVDAYKAGDNEKAKKLYPLARMHYERIEPTAESFGDLDPKLDEREADYQQADDADGREWTGWHRLEKDLWADQKLSAADRTKFADLLMKDTQDLHKAVYADDFKLKLDDISNGAIGLLEEVATTKITGEEEIFSHTDLYDFQANLEGARVAYGNVQALAEKKDPELAKKIDVKMKDLEDTIASYNRASGDNQWDFPPYTDIATVAIGLEKTPEKYTKKQKELSDKVNALRAPLAKLTESILK